MEWVGLEWDEGLFFQMQRYDRSREVLDQWLAEGKANNCCCSRAELDALREEKRATRRHVRYLR